MGPRLLLFVTLLGIGVWTGCDDKPRLQVQPNVPPTAAIDMPATVGRADLVRIDGSRSRDPDGRIVGYAWDFGDGSPASTASTAITFHTFNELGTFEVGLEVTDSRGDKAQATTMVEVSALPQNQSPIARISGPATAMAGQSLTFDGSGSSDPDGTIESHRWTLGAGGPTAEGAQATHTFTADGTYDVTLEVVDDRGAFASATHSVVVGSSQNLPPVANAGGDRNVGVGAQVTFDGTQSFDPDGTIVEYRWSLGDGSMQTGSTVTHTYNVESSFTVTLTVVDDLGLEGSDTIVVSTGQPTIDGRYTMEANPSMGSCGGLPATFVATTLTFAANGSMLQVTTPDPENSSVQIPLNGTLSGASFNVTGFWADSSGGDHNVAMTGNFNGMDYAGTWTETVSIFGMPICTLNWNVSGTKLP